MICYIFSVTPTAVFLVYMSTVSMLLLFRCAGTSGACYSCRFAAIVQPYLEELDLVVFSVTELPVLLPSDNTLARQGKNCCFANISGINEFCKQI